MKYCKYCGKEVSDDADFCRHCGKRLVSEEKEALEQQVSREYDSAPKPKKKRRALKAILIVALAVILAFVGLVVWIKLHTNIPPEKGDPPTLETAVTTTTTTDATADSASATMDKGADGFAWLNVDNPSASKPSSAEAVSDFETLRGEWKCVLVFDPVGSNTARTRDYADLSINGAEENFAVILDWDYYDDGFEKVDQSESEDTVLNGQWNEGELTTTGDCAMNVTFFSVDGNLYGIGTMEAVTGATGTVALYA